MGTILTLTLKKMSEKENNKEIENIETQISESSNKQETVEKEIIEDIKNEPVT